MKTKAFQKLFKLSILPLTNQKLHSTVYITNFHTEAKFRYAKNSENKKKKQLSKVQKNLIKPRISKTSAASEIRSCVLEINSLTH